MVAIAARKDARSGAGAMGSTADLRSRDCGRGKDIAIDDAVPSVSDGGPQRGACIPILLLSGGLHPRPRNQSGRRGDGARRARARIDAEEAKASRLPPRARTEA